jgi:long-chain acyl-CoA synthetase
MSIGCIELATVYFPPIFTVGEIAARFEAICQDEPQRPLIALPAWGKTITASDIWREHHAYVQHLTRRHVGGGDLLVCGAGNHPDLLPLLLACRSVGAAMMAVDTGATEAEVHALCLQFGAKALLTSAAASPADSKGTTVASGLRLVPCQGEPAAYPGVAMLKLTSGTSGTPRAVRTTEAQLVADGTQIMTTMGIGRDDTQLAVIPLAHSYGLGVMVMPLLLQGTGIILRESFIPPQLVADARQFDARRLPGVPFMFEYLIEHPPADGWPPRLTRLVSAGARLSPPTVRAFHERFGVKVHTYYGTTETGGITYDDSDGVDDTTTVGRPLFGVSLSLQPMAGLSPEHGRVHVRSRAVADGYVGADPGDFTDGGFLTGDYGSIGADDRLTLLGRVSSFINVAGRKVQPDEVEAVLRGMPAIADVRVVGAADAQRGQQVVACVVARPGMAAPSLREVRQFCSTALSAHKIPRAMFLVDAIPMNSRGKTDRAALEALARRHAGLLA